MGNETPSTVSNLQLWLLFQGCREGQDCHSLLQRNAVGRVGDNGEIPIILGTKCSEESELGLVQRGL
jgi:hypothetical protein